MIPWRARIASSIASISPSLRLVLVLATVLHGVGIFWGLPSSDAWDNDGIAPRDILPGIAATFTPGDYYTYPPVHLALLTVLTLPVTLVAVARAGTHVPDVVREMLGAPYMTALSLTARVVALLMSLGIAVALGKIAEELAGRERGERAGTLTAAFVSAGMPLTYYAHTSNLDVPSLFWASLAILAFVRALVRNEPRRLRHFAILAALAIATKDQTYALFLLSAPLVLFGRPTRAFLREVAIAVALGIVAILVLDGAVFNPTGFRARVAFLRGPASQDFGMYSKDFAGRLTVLADIGRWLPRHYPAIFGVGVLGGIVLALRRERVAALVPLAVVISFTVTFNCVALRVEDRFTLPHALFLAVYVGLALAWLWGLGKVAPVVTVGLLLYSAWGAVQLDLTLLREPRYAAEDYLAEHARPEDVVEIHGGNVYLPRFSRTPARVVRVGPTSPKRRGPMPGVEEVQARFMDIEERKPRFIVVSKCFVWRYLVTDTHTATGRVYPTSQQREADDDDATRFFQNLFGGKLAYRQVHRTIIEKGGWFEPVEIHASTNCAVTTFERQ